MILKNMPPKEKKKAEPKKKVEPKKKAEPFPLSESQELELDFDWLMDGDLDSENPRRL